MISSETATNLILIVECIRNREIAETFIQLIKYTDQFAKFFRSFGLVKCFKNYIDSIWHTFICVNLMAFNQHTAKCSTLNAQWFKPFIAHANGNDLTLKALIERWNLCTILYFHILFFFFSIFYLANSPCSGEGQTKVRKSHLTY